MGLSKFVESAVSRWEHVSVCSHRFGGREFRFNKAEIGHTHFWGDVDIPFPRPIRDNLVQAGLVQPHRWVPDSGWITFPMRRGEDVERAVWLLRLSWLRYALRAAPDPFQFLENEVRNLSLDASQATLFRHLMPNAGTAQPG
jgi:hypothetical protein